MKRIQTHKSVKDNPTKRKRQAGARFLYKPHKVKFWLYLLKYHCRLPEWVRIPHSMLQWYQPPLLSPLTTFCYFLFGRVIYQYHLLFPLNSVSPIIRTSEALMHLRSSSSFFPSLGTLPWLVSKAMHILAYRVWYHLMNFFCEYYYF